MKAMLVFILLGLAFFAHAQQSIQLTDAAKYYKSLPHQVQAGIGCKLKSKLQLYPRSRINIVQESLQQFLLKWLMLLNITRKFLIK
jgi:hypothetical protein